MSTTTATNPAESPTAPAAGRADRHESGELVGAPGSDGAVSARRSLSPSRAADFLTCPLLYRFRVLDRLPEPPSPAALRGTVVHRVLEELYGLPAGERTLPRAVELVPRAWDHVREAEPEAAALFDSAQGLADWLGSATPLLEAYFGLEDPTRLEPAERELRVEATLADGLVLRGFVDRLDVNQAGLTRVVDYKTGKAPRVGYEQRAMFQMRFYALVLWRSTGTLPTLLQLLYLGSSEVLRYEPDEADLRATERKVTAIWAAITRAYETGDWRPNPSRLCDWCAHQELCPAFGGTPPPLPDTALAVDDLTTAPEDL